MNENQNLIKYSELFGQEKEKTTKLEKEKKHRNIRYYVDAEEIN